MRRLIRSASLMGILTMLSRVLGYVRDALFAALFGAGMAADAFLVAFRIPNMLRDLVGEGAMSAAIVPSVSRAFAKRGPRDAGPRDAGPRDAHRLVSALLTWGSLGGVVLVAGGVLVAPVLVRVIAPGFSAFPGKFLLTVSLVRWLFPFIVFVNLAAITMAWLNSRDRFGPPAFAPVALNLCIIAGALVFCPLFGDSPDRRIMGWTVGVLLGGVAQWLVQIPAASRIGLRFRWRLWHPEMRNIGRLMVPALVGFSFTHVHLLINTILASLLPSGSVAHLYYGNRLMQLPLGVFGVALSVASYPAVVRALTAGRIADAAGTLNRALRLAAFALLPAAAGLVALAPQTSALLFRFGEFSGDDARVTASVCMAYAAGLIGHAVVRVLTPPFYAAGRPHVPVTVMGVGVVASVLLSSVLMVKLGVVGLPIATSAVALGSAAWLIRRARAIVPGVGSGAVLPATLRSAAAAAAMGIVVWLAVRSGAAWLAAAGVAGKAQEAVLTGGGIALGVAVFAGTAWLAGSEELREFLKAAGKKRE